MSLPYLVAAGGYVVAAATQGPAATTGQSVSSAGAAPDSAAPVFLEKRVLGLEAAMLSTGALVDPHEEHLFLPGLYIRQVTNEAGSRVVTMKHATEHPWFCLRGHLSVMNLETGEVREVWGGDRGVTAPGTQRAIYAHEETVFVTVHPNPDDCRDLEELERRFIVRQELPGGRTAGELFREGLAEIAAAREPAALEGGSR